MVGGVALVLGAPHIGSGRGSGHLGLPNQLSESRGLSERDLLLENLRLGGVALVLGAPHIGQRKEYESGPRMAVHVSRHEWPEAESSRSTQPVQ